MSQKSVSIQNIIVNDNTVNTLIQYFFNKAYTAGILSLAEASKMFELVQHLNKKTMAKKVEKHTNDETFAYLNKLELEISEKEKNEEN